MIHVGKHHIEALASLNSVCHHMPVFPYPVVEVGQQSAPTLHKMRVRPTLNSPDMQAGFLQQPSCIRVVLHFLNVNRCPVCREPRHLRSLHFRIANDRAGDRFDTCYDCQRRF